MTDLGVLPSLLAEIDALLELRRYEQAAERAMQAASLVPGDPRPYQAWSCALEGLGRFAEAADKASAAIRLAPSEPIGFQLRSIALRRLARQGPESDRTRLGGEAVTAAREAVRLAPHHPGCLLVLAQALSLVGEVEEADAVVREVINLSPNDPSTWVSASVVALAAKNWDAAIDASRRALAIEPDNYAALNNLGVALRATGKRREATTIFASAASLQPGIETARSNISRDGIRIVRIAILLILIPIGLVAHVGLGLYVVFGVGSNILISKNPGLALRLERWTAPLALRLAKRSKGRPSPPNGWNPTTGDRVPQKVASPPWSAVVGNHRIKSSLLLMLAMAIWATTAVLLVAAFVAPSAYRVPLIVLVVLFTVIAAVPTVMVARRRHNRAFA